MFSKMAMRLVRRSTISSGVKRARPGRATRPARFAGAEFVGVVEVRHVGEFVGVLEGGDDFLVDLVADVGLAFEGDHVFERGAGRDGDGGAGREVICR